MRTIRVIRCTSGPHRSVYSRPSCSNGVSSSNVKLRINLGPLFDARSLRKTLADACGFCSCRATQGPDRGISQALQNVDLDRGEIRDLTFVGGMGMPLLW